MTDPSPTSQAAPDTAPRDTSGARVREVFVAFLIQGLTAFGGPVAHLAYFRKAFVEKRGWLSEASFADLLALAHFLPGPSSSQLGMAIGLRRAGVAGAVAAWIGFTLPAALAMIMLGLAASGLSSRFGDGWVHGLQVAAAAIVLQALVTMARTLARGPIAAGIAIGAAIGLVITQGPVAQIFALVAAGVFGAIMLRGSAPPAPEGEVGVHVAPKLATSCLIAFTVLLVALPLAASLLGSHQLGMASVFYRTGALVFGGGHVVLPLLETEVVERGWMGQDLFLAGYGLMQALPGPLLAFAGFVGASQTGVLGGVLATLAIFLPSLLLIVGALPYWDQLKTVPAARAALAGVNAAVVGLLAAALWNPLLMTAVRNPGDWALVAGAFIFLAVAKLPPWAVVVMFAVGVGVFGS